MDKTNKTILVLGATGQQGGAVARQLLADGWAVRACTRDTDKPAAREMAQDGASVIRCDMDDRPSLDRALRGVYGCFSVQVPGEKEVQEGMELANAAKDAGVQHLVYTSVAGCDRNTGISFFESKNQIEQHIRSLGNLATIVRPVYFMENFNEPRTRQSIMQGVLSLPLSPDKRLQLISVVDIGGIVASVFDNPQEYLGRTLEIACDELSMVQIAQVLTRVIGIKVRYQQMPIEAISKANAEYGKMFRWINENDFAADLSEMRRIRPDLMSFEDWLKQSHYVMGAFREHVEAQREVNRL